jgi:hypothetical protein
MLWHWLHSGPVGMCLLNLVLFAVGFAVIASVFNLSLNEKFIWITTPSLYFMLAPYSEAWLFLFTSCALFGIYHSKRWHIWLALFLAVLTRPSLLGLLPALIIMELLARGKKDFLKSIGKCCLNYVPPFVLGIVVLIILHNQYAPTQSLQWLFPGFAGGWHLPSLPFGNTTGGNKIAWLTSLAMLVCCVSLMALLGKIFKWLFKNESQPAKVEILTMAYLPVVLFTFIFWGPVNDRGITTLVGLHRSVFCTAFLFVFLYHFIIREHKYRLGHFIAMFLLSNLIWLGMGAYVHLTYVLYFNFGSLLMLVYMGYANKKGEWQNMAIVMVNIVLQTMLFQQYLQGVFTD